MKFINSDKLLKADLPYSRGTSTTNTVFYSGHVGVDPDGLSVPETLSEQAQNIFDTFDILLKETKLERKNVLKMNIYIVEMTPDKLKEFNTVYAQWVGDHRPARTAIGVYSLPRGNVEIEMIAEK